MSKYTLKIDDIITGFYDETRILGIVSSLKNYQFCWKLNHSLGMLFKLNNELEVTLIRKNRTYHFSIYEYKEKANFLCHYIYINYNQGEYLLPELKNFDFIWLMKNDMVSDAYFNDLKNWIKDIKEVQLVTEITLDKIKNKGSLLF